MVVRRAFHLWKAWLPNTHIEVLEFIDHYWTSIYRTTTIVNAEAGGQGNSYTQNSAYLFSDCSYDSPDLARSYEAGQFVAVNGKGTGICTGWYVLSWSTGSGWLHGSKLQPFSASVATATPAPTQAPAPTVSSREAIFNLLTPFDGILFLQANDGTFLGHISSDRYDSNSICNSSGNYGSNYRNESIRNIYGTYGSEYSSESAYNKYTSTPPVIIKIGTYYVHGAANNRTPRQIVGYLTKNDYLSGAIDPDELLIALDCLR